MANSCCPPPKSADIISQGESVDQGHSHNHDHKDQADKSLFTRLKSVDRVVLGFALIMGFIAIYDMPQVVPSLTFVGESLWDIAPYLAISIAFAGFIKASGADALIGAAFRANAGKAVMVASIVGAFSPFCSCGVIPLIAALLASGVPIAPVMAFWLSSPVIDPEMMIVTTGILGSEFAIAKTIAAVSLGAMGGYLVVLIQSMGGFENPLRIAVKASCGSGAVTQNNKPVWAFWKEEDRRIAFLNESKSTTWFLFKWLSAAFLLEGLMISNLSMDSIGDWLAHTGNFAIPLAALIGAPAYLNGYAAIPLADSLMQLGLQPGAALAFMVAGGATCIPAAVAVKAMAKTPLFLTFIGVALFGSMIIGFGFELWLSLF